LPGALTTREIADRMLQALEDTGVFVVDKNLVDTSRISRLISVAGIDPLIRKVSLGEIEVYVLREELAEATCRQTRCREEPPERRRACIVQCYYQEIGAMLEALRKSIIEAAESIEE